MGSRADGSRASGGSGCYCPQGILLRGLIGHLLTVKNKVVLLDMEAGTGHLERAGAKVVDRLIIVVEP